MLTPHAGTTPRHSASAAHSVETGSAFDTPARWVRTSLLQYSPALVLVLIAIADAGRATDPDLWGHVRFGQAVLAGHRLVLHDPHSYTAPGHLWRNHEWLTEI